MFFSVVIPTHKRKQLLLTLLNSLAKQSLERDQFEVIVVATANDEAWELDLSQFIYSIKMVSVPNDPFQGRSASAKRNYGASLATAPWIAFTDDDCIASPQWLNQAHLYISKNEVQFLEGGVEIPVPKIKTFTYKGIQRLSHPGGFQTCNMFYRKTDFEQIRGFDPNFPYYLEDTDLAWSFLEHGKKPGFAEKAKVSHPVPPPAPKKMLESAQRMEKLSYLFKKHPKLYKESKMRALPRPYLALLTIDALIIGSALVNPLWVVLGLLARLICTGLILLRMMKGCQSSFNEVGQMMLYLLVCPIISLVYLIKGNLKNRVWIFIR